MSIITQADIFSYYLDTVTLNDGGLIDVNDDDAFE
jgi:hypothetical protein